MIPFNKPHFTGKEASYIFDAVSTGKISGNGKYTVKCHEILEQQFGFGKCFLTTSCTDALEMSAILLDIQPGDEVIVPSYTFVSTANAFVLRGAKIVFADSRSDHPGLDEDKLEDLITAKTKAIVPVHYAGIACDMDKIMCLAKKHNLFVVEDSAQAIDAFYTDRNGKKNALGSMGNLSAFSFHETKNIISGEGGMLVVNDPKFKARAEVIWEKGTNRAAFSRGEVSSYQWLDMGSSFLPSDILAAILFGQIESLEEIQQKRHKVWDGYDEQFRDVLDKEYGVQLPFIPHYASNNANMYYLVCKNKDERDSLLTHLHSKGIQAVFHYLPLHKSPFYETNHDGRELKNTDCYADCLLRLPFFYGLSEMEQEKIGNEVFEFYGKEL
ncbi:MAG TPA: dTDP-4-amino-4,6-dideoxygalactose transaminase [Flavobacteriaceae bacterium]|nr:dTDP-4-amino-4,6-dideoxygalactose transaminase [Flavobacteriaceae bacterium]